MYADTLQAYLSTKFCQGAFEQKELVAMHNPNALPRPQELHVKSEHVANATCAAVASQNMQPDDGCTYRNQMTPPGNGYPQHANHPQSLVTTHPMIQAPLQPHKLPSTTSSSSPNSNCPNTPTTLYNQQSMMNNTSQKSLNSRVMKSRIRFGNLMMQICMLRSVNFEHSQSILKIDVRRKEDLGPFLREMCFVGNENAS